MIGTTPKPGEAPGIADFRRRARQMLQTALAYQQRIDAGMKAAFDPAIGAEICLLSGH